MAKPTLLVVPNPYKVLDANGNPCNVYPSDPSLSPGEIRFVGATRRVNVLEKPDVRTATAKPFPGKPAQTVTAVVSPGRSKAIFDFRLDPVEIQDTAYHRRGLRSGDLLPANAATAQVARVQNFRGHQALLDAESQKARAAWAKEHPNKPLDWAQPTTTPEATAPAPK